MTASAGARALWAGPAAARALAAARTGVVEIALRPGGYLRLAGDPPDWLHAAPPRAPRGPLTLVVAGLDAAPLTPGARVDARDGTLAAGPLRIDLGGVLDIGPERSDLGGAVEIAPTRVRYGRLPAIVTLAGAPPRHRVRPGWRAALAAALGVVPAPPAELDGGLAALRRGELAEAVAALAGRGAGLTPAGDDVLAGFAAWRHRDGRAVALSGTGAGRCSPIGIAYLRCAERGELAEPAARAMRAIRDGDARLARVRAHALSSWGASSGAAILWGIAAAAAGASS